MIASLLPVLPNREVVCMCSIRGQRRSTLDRLPYEKKLSVDLHHDGVHTSGKLSTARSCYNPYKLQLQITEVLLSTQTSCQNCHCRSHPVTPTLVHNRKKQQEREDPPHSISRSLIKQFRFYFEGIYSVPEYPLAAPGWTSPQCRGVLE